MVSVLPVCVLYREIGSGKLKESRLVGHVSGLFWWRNKHYHMPFFDLAPYTYWLGIFTDMYWAFFEPWCHSNRAWGRLGLSFLNWWSAEESWNHLLLPSISCSGMIEYQRRNHSSSVFVCINIYVCVCLPDEHTLRLPTSCHLPTLSNHPPWISLVVSSSNLEITTPPA